MDLLILIILVSIIFGVSLHDAFWGIVAFSIGLTLFSIVVAIIVAFGKPLTLSIKDSFKKENLKSKAKKTKQNVIHDCFGALAFLWIVSPLLIGISLSILNEEFSINHPLIVFLLATLPFLIGCVAFITIISKRRTSK